jgi:23S rRNA (pseudouridine1915-N3)-methyltransferase
MKIRLLVVGKTKEKEIQSGINDYLKRLTRYTNFQMEIIPDVKVSKKMSSGEVKNLEGKEILKRLDKDVLILLDEKGKEFTSVGFAKWIENQQMNSTKQLTFLIGGAHGFSEEVYQRATSKIALSKMTFTHQMIRLIFIEQLYRAFTIIKGEKYHHY